MQPTISFDNALLNAQMKQFQRDTGRAAAKVVSDQARLFVRDLIGATPPFGAHAFNRKEESYNEQRKIGEAAVRRDVRRVFKGVAGLAKFLAKTFNRPELEQEILRYARMSDTSALQTMFQKMLPHQVVKVMASRKDHTARRNRRGRVSKNVRPIVILDERSIRDYEKEEVSHVGKGKAGWLAAAIGLGVKGIPNWIRRHASAGLFSANLKEVDPSVTIGNLVEYGAEWPSELFEAAVENRIRSLKIQAHAIVEASYKKHGGGGGAASR